MTTGQHAPYILTEIRLISVLRRIVCKEKLLIVEYRKRVQRYLKKVLEVAKRPTAFSQDALCHNNSHQLLNMLNKSVIEHILLKSLKINTNFLQRLSNRNMVELM